ncbi:trypsin-like peptidase domain-containing protein [Halobacteriovorax sp. GB3]|uniref:trypsin-like serine peptidase n=1 Tax=Halobacteriovorax sp. GB3 TaxID=2719615 RepID=UPI002361DF9D|nr:trypsin-like peptidase domain-containing protein [Halobacteriovorax sp. GB3]MDD0854341.1 trypsin-like peptidase domain-containing protein [Halobacteriovorax sp. GB3]
MKVVLKATFFFLIFINAQAECLNNKSVGISTKDLGNFDVLLKNEALNITMKSNTVMHKDDDREIRKKSSPKWLAAVGRLNNHCSATLVGNDSDDNSRIATTAFHCLKSDRPIILSFLTNDGKIITRKATVLNKGNHIEDRAILLLESEISHTDIEPLILGDMSLVSENDTLTAAGYSADKEKGSGGKLLTFDSNCKFISKDIEKSDNHIYLRDCFAYGGASGGAIVYHDGEESFIIGHLDESTLEGGVYGYGYYEEFYSHENFLEKIFDAMDTYNSYDD